MPTDTQERIKELLNILAERGTSLVGEDGKMISQTVKELEQEINKLKKENEELKKTKGITTEEFERRLGGKENFDDKGVIKGIISNNQQPVPTPPVPKPEEPIIPSDQLTPEQKEWNDFFSGKNDIDDKNAWKSSLSVEEAKKVYANGWRSITNKHSSEGQTTENIDQKIHQKGEIEKAHNLLKRIKNETDLSKLPKDGEIGTGAYDEGKVPSSINHAEIRKERDNKLKSLFKIAFEGGNISHGLSDDEIDKWRTTETGLGGKGINERKAVDNGWVDKSGEIKNSKLPSYKTLNTDETDTDIDVLKVVRTELDRANDLVKEIKAATTFKQIDDWKKTNESRVGALTDSKLPENKQQKGIWNIFTNHRNTFKYYLNVKDNEVENDGLEQSELNDAREKLKEENRWKSKEFKPLTASILNELLADFFDPNANKEDLNDWLKGLGGYTIDREPAREITVAEVKEIDGRDEFTGNRIKVTISGAEVAAKEKKWSDEERLDLTGTYLLAFVHDLIGFDLDSYRPNEDGSYNKDDFAKLDEKGLEIDKAGKGVAPILTGGGKTTKDICCLVNGGKNNIILVCPNEALAADAQGHHKTWLQKNKCVTHGVNHGTYEVIKNDLIYYEDKTDPANVKKMGQKGLSILQGKEVLGFIARSATKISELKEPTPKALEKIKTEGNDNKDFNKNIAEIKTKLISKEETIIVFDEAHFSDAKYQELQKQLVKNNYQVIIMSATFPKKPFSITTSHPRDVYLVKQFEPEYGKDGKTEKWSQQKTQIFLRTTEDEWTLSVTGKKEKQVLVSGLTEKQKKLLDDSDIAYVCFDRTNQEAVTGITQGMPYGSLFFANPDHEMGFSPFVHNVILAGKTQLISLGKGKDAPWLYDNPEEIPLPTASMVQQIGRVSRLFPGTAYLLTKELQEVRPSKDLSYKFVGAIMSGDLSALIKSGITNMGKEKEPNFLRAAVSLPYKFGYNPEEIIVGLRGQPVPSYPTYKNKPNVVDEELWNRHLGNPTPPQIDKERSEQILLLIVMTFLKNQADITKKIDISFDNPLIKDIWGKEVPKKGGKKGETEIVIEEKAAEEVRKVLRTFVDKRRTELKGYKEGKDEYSAEEKDTYDALVGLYRVINGAEIKVEMVEDKGKIKPTIKIAYPATVGKRILEEINVWRCHRCLKVNNGYRFCEECGIDVRIDREEKAQIIEQEILIAQVLQQEVK